MTDIRQEIEAWLHSIPATSVTPEVQALVTYIWQVHASIKQASKQKAKRAHDPNRSRKQAARLKELNHCIDTPRNNGGESMALEQEAYRDKCRQQTTLIAGLIQAGAYGLYMPEVIKRQPSPRYAVWQLPDGSWVTPKPGQPLYSYRALYESLSFPRVPVPFTFDEACLVTNF